MVYMYAQKPWWLQLPQFSV